MSAWRPCTCRFLTAALSVVFVAPGAQAQVTVANRDARLSERAHQDREIVYFLQQPETHAFDLYHDYTESRPGVDRYVNVVREGSRVSRPSARILDTGDSLPAEIVAPRSPRPGSRSEHRSGHRQRSS